MFEKTSKIVKPLAEKSASCANKIALFDSKLLFNPMKDDSVDCSQISSPIDQKHVVQVEKRQPVPEE